MASLEKITFSPLVEHLKSDAAYYNQLLSEYEIKHGKIDGSTLHSWMSEVLQPVLFNLAIENESIIAPISQVFFKELLRLLANGDLRLHAKHFETAWKKLLHNPSILCTEPSKLLLAINSALISLHKYVPLKVGNWIRLMETIIDDTRNIDDFLHAGRVISWLLGMAHVRENAQIGWQSLPKNIRQKLENRSPIDSSIEEALKKPWHFYGQRPKDTFGGFIGFENGLFLKTPQLALIDNCVVASDGENSCAIFADVCGATVLSEIKLSATFICKQNQYNISNKLAMNIRKKYSDIHSILTINNSVLYTRKSSFKIFLSSN